ncbi:MAG: hypothetical protein WCD35_05005 [Mycobacteriales bacterium]
MTTIITVAVGLLLAGATTFGLVAAQSGDTAPNRPAVTYSSGQ